MTNASNILLRRKNMLLIPETKGITSRALIATFNLNIQSLGYTLHPDAVKALILVDELTVIRFFNSVIADLKELRGVRSYRPMYPNFPQQVIDATDAELYINAIIHYFSFWMVDATGDPNQIWLPKYVKEQRAPLVEKVPLTVLRVGDTDDLVTVSNQLASANTSISATDKEDLRWLIQNGYFVMPERVPNKENLAVIGAMLFTELASWKPEFITLTLGKKFKTATDVLRLAVALSDGDVSLAAPTKFRKFKRKERKSLLELLEGAGNIVEDMSRWKERWLRLGEILHPGNYAKRFPRSFAAFEALRHNAVPATFNSQLEKLLRGGTAKELNQACLLLQERPGVFARRLDEVLRQAGLTGSNGVLGYFRTVAEGVSTPVLLQLMTHFENRGNGRMRVVFPKGNIAKVQAIPKAAPLSATISRKVVENIQDVLRERFAELPRMGKVYIDPALNECLVPFSQRSASAGLRTLVRGSRVPFDTEKNTIRFFIWWKEQKGNRCDLDLSTVGYDESFTTQHHIAYYNLRENWGRHSGDITSAPNGACEFIDVDIEKAMKAGVRYVVMSVNSFTGQNFCDLAECKAGWMVREHAQKGEVFEPKTVVDKIDVTMEAKAGIPMILDLVDRKVIWADLALTPNSRTRVTVYGNRNTFQLLTDAMLNVRKPSVGALLKLHAEARGRLVNTPEEANVVFSLEEGTHFQLDKIASEFMQDAVSSKVAAS